MEAGSDAVRGGRPWDVFIDTGGTFTDCIGRAPDGGLHLRKVLSSGRVRGMWRNRRFEDSGTAALLVGAAVEDVATKTRHGTLGVGPEIDLPDGRIVDLVPDLDAPRLAMHLLTATPLGAPLPPFDLRVATTRATNALLEGTTAPVVLLTTGGFEDLIAIDDQTRPDLFALHIKPRRQTPITVIPVPRVPSESELEAAVDAARAATSRHRDASVAVSLLHAWRDPNSELELARRLRSALPTTPIVAAIERSPGVHLLSRTRTVVADASLHSIMGGFFDRLDARPGVDRVAAMTSGGGLVPMDAYRPAEALLSGPAAGVLGALAAGRRLGFAAVVAFDMGGTSTDVARADGRVDLRDETTVADATVRLPSVDIDTIAAGGGSICEVRDGRLEVGPRSAGADPGPACYGAGGPLTLTDVNLLLDRLDPHRFGVPVDVDAARRALRTIAESNGRREDDLLEGFFDLANERMAEAIRNVATRRGVDPGDHALVSFGGAGGQHACGVAERLGIRRIVAPEHAGLLSAAGLSNASHQRVVERTILRGLAECDLDDLLSPIEFEALQAAREMGVSTPKVLRRQWRCRRRGGEATLDLEFDDASEARDGTTLATRFHETFQAVHGYHLASDAPIEIASARVFAGESPSAPDRPAPDRPEPPWTDGPGIVANTNSTLVVDAKWSWRRHETGDLELVHRDQGDRRIAGPAASEIMACRLESIASDMGEMLRRTASSVNVRERLDYSCAIVDAHGNLVVNAPHVPVHLGAMGDCVRLVRDRVATGRDDVILVNHPAYGGSHLPDLTLVSPVHDDLGGIIGYVVNRAHHAEIGGTRPGSMPPDATCLEEEGVVFEPVHLVRGGVFDWATIERRLRDARHPSRAVEENLADLAAQAAANRLGCERLRTLHHSIGVERFQENLDILRRRCRTSIERLIHRIDGLDRKVIETLDDGWSISVSLRASAGRLAIDLSGSGKRHPGNLNAPRAVVRAAILYVLRVVAGESFPLNDGVFEVVDLECPPGFLAPHFTGDPASDPAVAVGNTETSQRLVDALLRAFDVAACSQGTMNNLLLGDAHRGFYETICGGTGAGPDFDGADAVHSHMTNTRITDPEILELRYPVTVERFEIRRRSGGDGLHRGGDGARRVLVATAPLIGSLLGQHRRSGPYGSHGGADGSPGREEIIRADGRRIPLSGMAAFDLGIGDRLVVETPGGGGWGASHEGIRT